MRHYLLCLLLLATACSAIGASLDKKLLSKGYSYAPTENGKVELYQVVALLERAVQQNDLSQFSLLAFSDSCITEKSNSQADFENRVSERFTAAEKTLGASSAATSGWKLTGFRNFRFLIDSVSITGDSASVSMHSAWTDAGNSGPLDRVLTVRLKRSGVRWYFCSPEQLLQLLDQYLSMECELNSSESTAQRQERAASASSSPSSTRFSPLLFRPVSWSTTYSIPRATWAKSREYLSGQKLFGCVSSVSSYVYLDADDFAADLIAASDECWRRIVVVDDHPDHNYIVSKGRYGVGATADEFLAPRGMEFSGPSYLYIAEDSNNRIKILRVSTLSNDHVELFKFITRSELNHPQDLDVMAADQYGERKVIVANTGGNNILAMIDAEPSGPGVPVIHSGIGYSVGAFNRPTSIAFGRNPLTSEKSAWCYFIDSGNKRIVKIGNVFSAPTYNSYEVHDDFPDLRTDLSGIGVDNKGEVWVVDRGLGRIYKFTSGLVPIATHGMTGTADGEYLRPTSISFTEGYEYGVGPIANLGEVVLGEEWGEDTGIRRLVSGTEILDAHLYYNPKLADGTAARLSGDYFITGYSNLTEQYITPNGATYTNTFNMRPSGLEPFNFTIPPGSPSGTYQVKIKAQSIYQNSNTDSITLSISVDASAVNQLPVVNCIYFPSGDTCFEPYVMQRIAAHALDPDGSIASYFWSCSPSDAGEFSNPYANPTYFTPYPQLAKSGDPRFVRVRVTDNYGQYSYYRSVDIDQCPMTSSCACVSCGDANSDGSVDISDIVFLIAHIFQGGVIPADCNYRKGRGDANGDGSADISDAVYLIARIFSGGAAPHCQGM
jgi:hypothetical protein